MATILTSNSKDFTPHPEGQFIAVMRDVYLNQKPNPWKGRIGNNGKEDQRETITEIVMEFLTDHTVEVDGKQLPGFVRYTATASVADGSNLRKFLKSWFPALKDADFERFDADKLIGRGAYLTVAHNVSKANGKTYANVVGAMQPPKGFQPPAIPSDFVRKQDREVTSQTTNDPTPAQVEEDDNLPF